MIGLWSLFQNESQGRAVLLVLHPVGKAVRKILPEITLGVVPQEVHILGLFLKQRLGLLAKVQGVSVGSGSMQV